MLDLSSNSNRNVSVEFRDTIDTLTITISQLLSRLEHVNQEAHERTRDEILKKICERQGDLSSADQIKFGIEMLNVSDASERQLRISIQESIIKSLRYPSMTHRYEDVIEAHPNTFKWAFRTPPMINCYGATFLSGCGPAAVCTGFAGRQVRGSQRS